MKVSENYQTFVDVMAGISITDIVMDDNMKQKLIEQLITDKKCPRCGKLLYVSDMPDYDYVCPECDESFYECEVEQ